MVTRVQLQVEDPHGKKTEVWVTVGETLRITMPVTFTLGRESKTMYQDVPVKVLRVED